MTGNKESVLFVGGPWDGHRRVIEARPPKYHVALHSMASAIGVYYDPRPEYIDVNHVTYTRIALANDAVVYLVDAEKAEQEYHNDRRGYAIRELLKGYRNF